MRWPIISVLVATLAGCASLNSVTPDPTQDALQGSGEAPGNATPAPATPPLPDLGPAPELASEVWLNSETSLRLVDLRGKVVLLDMWTFG